MKRNTKNYSLNGIGTELTNKVGSTIWGADALDKRNSSDRENLRGIVNTVSSMVSTLSDSLGNRNPYYIIGEIPNQEDKIGSIAEKYLGNVGGAVRAITKLAYSPTQEGVIIDCLGDVDGESAVEFTQNPIMYVTGNVTDSRMRKPASVNAVVAVSNYRSDTIIEQTLSSIGGAVDITGGWMKDVLTSNLFYGGNTRAQYALYRLRWLMENGVPFTVHTPHGIYENMLIKSIRPRTDDTKMDMLYATIEFEEVIMYTTYKQTLKGAETPTMPARTAITKGNTAVSWIRGGLV